MLRETAQRLSLLMRYVDQHSRIHSGALAAAGR
jgi:hypothetical protein